MSEHASPKTESVLLPGDEAADTGHVYDGIAELDHRLPKWWLFTLWAAIVFAIGYWMLFHTLARLPLPSAVYVEELRAHEAREAAREAALVASGQGVSEEMLRRLAEDASAVQRGHDVYMTNCQACHRADGGGLIGPNLTDDVALYGGKLTDLYRVASEGVVAKGMPAWKAVLGAEKLKDVVVYIAQLAPASGGKEPQGTPFRGASTAPVEEGTPQGGQPPAGEGVVER